MMESLQKELAELKSIPSQVKDLEQKLNRFINRNSSVPDLHLASENPQTNQLLVRNPFENSPIRLKDAVESIRL